MTKSNVASARIRYDAGLVSAGHLPLERLVACAAAAWAACCISGCDLNAHSTDADAGTDVAAVLACSVPASAPSMGSCVGDISASIACNPVTNAPCAAGQTCDTTADSSSDSSSDSSGTVTGFKCWDGPNDAGLCDLCSVPNGVLCAGGLSCTHVTAGASACARFCCTNADCGSGTCVTVDGNGQALFGTAAPNLGVCTAPAGDAGAP